MSSKEQVERKHTEDLLCNLELTSYTLLTNPPGEPDFTLNIDGLNIGIEHTRLYLNKDSKGVNLTIHTKVAERIMERARQMFESKQSEKLTVYVDFRNSYGLGGKFHMLTNNDVNRLGEFLSKFVTSNIPPYGEWLRFNWFDFASNSIILPPEIVSIHIFNKYSLWSTRRGGIVPRIQGDALSHRINEKNSKVRNYKGVYNEIWLLLVEDQGSIDTYFDFEDVDNIIASSYFNKLFVLRHGANMVYRLVNNMSPEVRWPFKYED